MRLQPIQDPLTQHELLTRARSLGLELPAAPTPKGSYTPAIAHGGVVYTSGVGPMLGGIRRHSGYVGSDVTVPEAREAAAIAAVNALMAAVHAIGGIEHLERVIRMTGYVRSAPGFTEQTTVVDAASQRLIQLLGQRGNHARSAVGVAELPFGISVEIELIAACRQ